MKRKKLTFIVGLFFIGNSQTVFAENFNDVCSNTIEGANIAMSKEEVQSTWQHAGFENSKHKQKKHKLSKQPESIQSLLFQTKDRQPNENFVKLLGWKQTLSKPHSLNITNAQGCRVNISNLNLRGYKAAFTVSIENNQ